MVLTSITSGIRDVTVVLVLIVLVLRLYWESLEKNPQNFCYCIIQHLSKFTF